jgi:hypothetical protein
MKKMKLQDKPKIELDLDQTETVVRHEMMWHLTYSDDTPKKFLKAMMRVLKYYSSQEQYHEFMKSLKTDWREIAQ